MATMKDIADLAGVSRGTVDRVLNNRGIVNANTKKKVLEIAKLLNYQPNKAGLALAAQKKKFKIGVLLFGVENPFFDEVMIGLKKKLIELSIYGCTIIEKRIPFDLKQQLDAMDEFVAEGVHGIILSPYNDSQIQKKIDSLADLDIPCITVNTDIPHSKRIAYVGSDYNKCGQTAAGLLGLITNGTATVGIITGSHNVLCHEARIFGFLDHLLNKYPKVIVAGIAENNDDEYQSYDAVNNLLTTRPDINALYFTAAGVSGGCQAISTMKRKDLTVITFDAIPTIKELLQEGLVTATICQQPMEQGCQSLAILMDYLLTKKAPESELNHMDLSILIKENL